MPLYIGNDHIVTLSSLQDVNGNDVDAATVQATLLNAVTLDEVSGITWPISLEAQGAGEYSGIIDRAVNIQRGHSYVLRVAASEGSTDEQWDIAMHAQWRD